MIHPTAIIYPSVTIEENVTIGAYCIIGAPAEMKVNYPSQSKGVIIKSGTVITGHVTIDAGYQDATIIGSNCFLMKGAHIGHDAHLEDNVTISCHGIIGGHSRVQKFANIGLGAIVHQMCLVGGGSMVGMGTIVTKKTEVKPFSKYVGSPARSIGDNTYLIDRSSQETIKSIEYKYEQLKSSGLFLNV